LSKVKIIANPISGRGRSRALVEKLSTELLSRGLEVETFFTAAKGDAIKAAADAEEGYAAVCAVGGDGTMNEVLNGIARKKIPLALLPAGLSNVLAVELGITADPRAVAEAIAKNTAVEVDLCFADGRYFVAMGSAGWDAHIVHSIARSRKSHLGFPGYVLPIARSLLTYDFPHIKVVLDGAAVTDKAGLVVVGNIRQYGGPFRITDRADFTDGLLDVYVVKRATPAQMLKLFAAVLWGDHTRHGNASYLRGRKLELTSSGEVPVHIDGEASGHLPRIFEMTGTKVRVIAPRRGS
jgi:YegS/Rv2252/BmrU family lipid kinase